MKRATLALAFLAVSVLSIAPARVFPIRCCAVSFRSATPFCSMAKQAGHHPVPSTAPAKQVLRAIIPVRASNPTALVISPLAAARKALRNQMTLGALRCDDDIGLHTLFATFLI